VKVKALILPRQIAYFQTSKSYQKKEKEKIKFKAALSLHFSFLDLVSYFFKLIILLSLLLCLKQSSVFKELLCLL